MRASRAACAVLVAALWVPARAAPPAGDPRAAARVASEAEAAAADDAWVIVRDPRAPLEPLAPAWTRGFGFKSGYRFSEDWFTKRIPYWVAMLVLEMPPFQALDAWLGLRIAPVAVGARRPD